MKTPTCPKDSTEPALRILLVDDNQMGLAARRAILQEQGYQITTASDGMKALEEFRTASFDLVITDYKMPKMDGLKLIQAIRATNSTIPIILISGFVEALGMSEETTGANSVIAKSAHEIPHLIRAAKRLLKTPKKPVASQRATPKARRQSV